MEIIKKRCRVCGHMRKFLLGSEREIKLVCGDCWNWDKKEEK